ncbi:MAG TPA: hypothetical protein VHT73_13965, partial [Thermodesulfobacteriota bacterium]|nr:hypothetical protein [Thermodesulfobacteriota bacterium]
FAENDSYRKKESQSVNRSKIWDFGFKNVISHEFTRMSTNKIILIHYLYSCSLATPIVPNQGAHWYSQ